MANTLTVARMVAMEKHGYGPVYDLLGLAMDEFNGDCSAALVWLAEKVVTAKAELHSLKQPAKRPMKRIRSRERECRMKPGQTFIHSRFLDQNNQPMQCTITAIRNGMIYFHDNGGSKWKKTFAEFVSEYRDQFQECSK